MSEPRPRNATHTVPATIRTDDDQKSINFDAGGWFDHATDDEILSLAACGWKVSEAADLIAYHHAERYPKGPCAKVFHYIERQKPYAFAPDGRKEIVGFEVWVNEEIAAAHVEKTRPGLLPKPEPAGA